MLTYLKYGTMLIGGAGVDFTMGILSLLIKMYFAASILAVLAVIAYIFVHKSINLYQKYLSKYLLKVKEYKKAYENEEVLSKKANFLKKYEKNLKKLRKEIKTILKFNSKKIYIPTSLLNDKTNLSLDVKNPDTFKDELNMAINKQGKHKTKILETLVGKKQVQQINSTPINSKLNVTTFDTNDYIATTTNVINNNTNNKLNTSTDKASDILSTIVKTSSTKTSTNNTNKIYTDDEAELTK